LAAIIPSEREGPVATVVTVIDFSIIAIMLGMMARAAVSLWRVPGARRPMLPWLALIVVLAGAGLVVHPYVMSAGSMENTLLVGDYVLFDTVTWKLGRSPRRGDVVMLRSPLDPRQTFTKRVVGIPGDRVRLASKQLYLNGVAVTEPY